MDIILTHFATSHITQLRPDNVLRPTEGRRCGAFLQGGFQGHAQQALDFHRTGQLQLLMRLWHDSVEKVTAPFQVLEAVELLPKPLGFLQNLHASGHDCADMSFINIYIYIYIYMKFMASD